MKSVHIVYMSPNSSSLKVLGVFSSKRKAEQYLNKILSNSNLSGFAKFGIKRKKIDPIT